MTANCGDNKPLGVKITGTIDQNTDVNPKGGDGDEDYVDSFILPSALKVALKSVKLLKKGDNTVTYDVLDTTSFSNPLVIDLKTGIDNLIKDRLTYPSTGDYDKVQLEISYYEIIILICDNKNSCHDRAIRFYLSNNDGLFDSPQQWDILIEEPPSSGAFSWIDKTDGSLISLRGDPASILQVPEKFRSDGTSLNGKFTEKVSLSKSLNIPSSPTGIYIINLKFAVNNLFFYDNTDENVFFNPYFICKSNCTDGKLDSIDPSADFYPVLPGISAALQ